MPLTFRTPRLRLVVLVTVALLVAVAVWRLPGAGKRTLEVHADFVDTTGIYVGNEVQYLGVPIGHITGITPGGTVMTVHMEVDADVEIPRDAGAEILQSALLTDRYVQLGPAYRGGPTLADDAHIAVEHTRSPISIDDVGKAIDELVVALDRTGPGGKDIGDLLHATAETFDGNGDEVRDLILASRRALSAINDKAPDLKAVVANLSVVARTLTAHDGTVRRLTRTLATTSDTLAAQSPSLRRTLGSLEDLTASVRTFVEQNRSRLSANLKDVAAVAETIHQQQGALSRIFDLMPTGAENIARAFDPKRGAIRVQMALRDMLVFSDLVRAQFCDAYFGGKNCKSLFNAEGTGALDRLLHALAEIFPTRFPWG